MECSSIKSFSINHLNVELLSVFYDTINLLNGVSLSIDTFPGHN